MECFVEILNNDDTCYDEKTGTYDYEKQSEKDLELFDGAIVQYAEYKCYIKQYKDNECKETEKAYEELKRDVKRYFDERNRLKTILPSNKELMAFWDLEKKLSKVGEKE